MFLILTQMVITVSVFFLYDKIKMLSSNTAQWNTVKCVTCVSIFTLPNLQSHLNAVNFKSQLENLEKT